MTIPIAIHAKRIVGTALAYNPVPSCYSKEQQQSELEEITCNMCGGCCEDEDGDECWNCEGSGYIPNPKYKVKPRTFKKTQINHGNNYI